MASIKKYREHTPNVSLEAYLAGSVTIIGSVSVDDDTNIWDGVVARGDINSITIGKGVSIQENTVVHVGYQPDEATFIGDYSLIGHSCIIHGCKIEENCMVGMGAIIMNRAIIRENSVIAAGSIVTEGKEYPPNSLIMGSPAKVVREISKDDLAKMRKNVDNYIELGKEYKSLGI
ncbi:MAG: gamma carbonic anhydrase family protein [Defluviitaleaceae bacterium]|nr:gamma carbonic anhydrase family protein [Defluviitaleaceae bacterium]